jgi:hypothetical protein
MIRVIKKDGVTAEVSEAVAAEVMGKEVVCYDRRGVIVARFPSEAVTLFGPHLPLARDVLAEPADDSAEVS